jgi:hypothetical protein
MVSESTKDRFVKCLLTAFTKAGEESLDMAMHHCTDSTFIYSLCVWINIQKLGNMAEKITHCDYKIVLDADYHDHLINTIDVVNNTDIAPSIEQQHYLEHITKIAQLYTAAINADLNQAIYTPAKNTPDYRLVLKFEQMRGNYDTLEQKISIWRRKFPQVEIDNHILSILIQRSIERHIYFYTIVDKYKNIIKNNIDTFQRMLRDDVSSGILKRSCNRIYNLLLLVAHHYLIRHIFLNGNYITIDPETNSTLVYTGPNISSDDKLNISCTSDECAVFNYYRDGFIEPYVIETPLRLRDLCDFHNVTRARMLINKKEIVDVCDTVINK